jgi:hypothetical protein
MALATVKVTFFTNTSGHPGAKTVVALSLAGLYICMHM